MRKFVNTLDHARFESTNALWNRLMLNDPWSVGYVTTLIESRIFENKEAWEEFYYASGEERDKKMSALPPEISKMLNYDALIRKDKAKVQSLKWDLKNLNFQYGRTKPLMVKKGKLLYRGAQYFNIEISEAECIEAVRFRVICQTWNGVVIREKNAVEYLQKLFPKIEFRKTDGKFDHRYAVDFEAYKNGHLICGLQIKPPSYLRSKAPYVLTAKKANERKNGLYFSQYGKPVFDIIFGKGKIENPDAISKIKELI